MAHLMAEEREYINRHCAEGMGKQDLLLELGFSLAIRAAGGDEDTASLGALLGGLYNKVLSMAGDEWEALRRGLPLAIPYSAMTADPPEEFLAGAV